MNVASRVFEAMARHLVEMARRVDVPIVMPRKEGRPQATAFNR